MPAALGTFQFSTAFSQKIFNDRYTLYPEEGWRHACKRVADHVAVAEKDIANWSEEFYNVISTGEFCPGGRIWYGAGRRINGLLNCFVLPVDDSREGWAKMLGDNLIISGTGGGVGTNFSDIRPRGVPIRGTGGFATGAVSLMRIDNGVDEEIKGGAGRRSAKMKALDLNHPDLEEFLDCKRDLKQLNNANISVIFNSNPEEFFAKVRNDEPWDLVWNNEVLKTIPAKDIWDRVVSNFLKNGEPGILNGYLANRLSNIAYCRELVCTNPCGEIFMQPYSTCCLGSLVLPKFVRRGEKYGQPPARIDRTDRVNWAFDMRWRIDWTRLEKAVRIGVRFLDDVLDVTYYPTKELHAESQATRRIGLGTMGVHDMLLQLGVKYSSEEGRYIVDKVMDFIKDISYDEGANLAVEKGVFPEYDADAFGKSKFITHNLCLATRSKVRELGSRCCAYNTQAPTGTTGMAMGVSTGVEAIFSKAYQRTYKDTDHKNKTEVVVHPLFEEFVLAGLDTAHFEDSSQIHPLDHLKMQEVFQKHTDNAVSKTINIPKGMYAKEEFSDLLMEWFPKLKGITVYPEGSRGEEPLSRMNDEEAIKLIKLGKVTSEASGECSSGTCAI